MSYPARFLTRGDRAHRRDKITAAMREGIPTRVVADRFGVSIPWVRQIAKAVGLQRKPGRRQA